MVRSPTISQVVTVQKLKKLLLAELARPPVLLDSYRVKKRSLKNLKIRAEVARLHILLDGYRVKTYSSTLGKTQSLPFGN